MPIFNPQRPTFIGEVINETNITEQVEIPTATSTSSLLNRDTWERYVGIIPNDKTQRPKLYTWIDNPEFDLSSDDPGESTVVSGRYWISVSGSANSGNTPSPTPSPTPSGTFSVTQAGWDLVDLVDATYRLIPENLNLATGEWWTVNSTADKANLDPNLDSSTVIVEDEVHSGKKGVLVNGDYDLQYLHNTESVTAMSRIIVLQGDYINATNYGESGELGWYLNAIEEMIQNSGEAFQIYYDSEPIYMADDSNLALMSKNIIVIGYHFEPHGLITTAYVNGHTSIGLINNVEPFNAHGTVISNYNGPEKGYLLEDIIIAESIALEDFIENCNRAALYYGAEL